MLKANSKNELNESTFREISKVIENYNRCGMYALRYRRNVDAIEREYWNDYKRIVDLFLWPYVALWTTLIKEETHKNKVLQLIHIILKEN